MKINPLEVSVLFKILLTDDSDSVIKTKSDYQYL